MKSSAIIDRLGAQSAHRTVLALRGRGQHAQIPQPSQLQHGGADAARPAANQDRTPTGNEGDAPQHLLGSGVIEHQCCRLRGIHARPDGGHAARLDHDVLGIGLNEGQTGHPVPDREAGHISAHPPSRYASASLAWGCFRGMGLSGCVMLWFGMRAGSRMGRASSWRRRSFPRAAGPGRASRRRGARRCARWPPVRRPSGACGPAGAGCGPGRRPRARRRGGGAPRAGVVVPRASGR